ncbi:MAG: GNAT family N-acetyltransferase [Croceibacterium sp.]
MVINHIRVARATERAALEALQWRASLVGDQYRDDLLANPDAIELPDDQIEQGYVHVCERNGAVVGFMVVLPREDRHAELDGLFVDPDVWRSGIGRTLVDEARAFAARSGAPMLRVVANPDAISFYEACGFSACGTEATRFGLAVTMSIST